MNLRSGRTQQHGTNDAAQALTQSHYSIGCQCTHSCSMRPSNQSVPFWLARYSLISSGLSPCTMTFQGEYLDKDSMHNLSKLKQLSYLKRILGCGSICSFCNILLNLLCFCTCCHRRARAGLPTMFCLLQLRTDLRCQPIKDVTTIGKALARQHSPCCLLLLFFSLCNCLQDSATPCRK